MWELGTAGRMALPTHVDRVVRFAGADAPGRLWAVVTPRDGGEGVDAEVVDEDGRVRVRLEGYRTIELPGGVDAEALAPLRAAMGRRLRRRPCSVRSRAWRSSTAASPRCGSSTRCASSTSSAPSRSG